MSGMELLDIEVVAIFKRRKLLNINTYQVRRSSYYFFYSIVITSSIRL